MKYTVSIAIDGRLDIEVEAADPIEAREKAEYEFLDADISKMEIVGTNAVNCSDEDGNIVKDY